MKEMNKRWREKVAFNQRNKNATFGSLNIHFFLFVLFFLFFYIY